MNWRFYWPALLAATVACAADNEVTLDTCDQAPSGQWKYIGGQEFPGAKGGLELDAAVKHGGAASYRLDADFTGGGAYVGWWMTLDDLVARDVKAVRMWVKAKDVKQVGVRLNDATGQCHQTKDVPLKATEDWQELVLDVSKLVGGEHWGGANDGQWHASAKGLGINIGSTDVGAGKQGSLWFDDIRAEILPPGVPTLLSVKLSQNAARPAYGLDITYRWDAEPMGRDYDVFVHLLGPDGKTRMQHDHLPPVPTSQWSGHVEYTNVFVAPTDCALGDWKINVGLWDRKSGKRIAIKSGDGVKDAGEMAFTAGTLPIAADAPIPPLAKPSLNLDGYKVTFDEDFTDKELSASRQGPGTRWMTHTPYWGDFGDAGFADPGPNGPFKLVDGMLHITARKVDGKWQSGLLASVDVKGEGFSQQYGYFEMRAKLPKGPGTWPAFWLLTQPGITNKKLDGAEIDIVEQYGEHPNALHTTVHRWLANGTHTGEGRPAIVEGMDSGFHTYGAMVQPDFITFYYDRAEIWKAKTPQEAKQPLYLLVNLALGGGWSIEKTPDPSVMIVDYVRAWAK